MTSDRRLVYSTESGQLDKPMQGKRAKRGKEKQKSAPAITNPVKQGVRIRRESKGRGGKTVTVIDGLALDQANLKALLKRLKARLGTGGAIKDANLEIQGEHRETVLQLLEKEGINAKISGG